jgi:hypothetical protein
LVARVERERGRGGSAEGTSERGEVGEQGAGAGMWPENAGTWPENAWTWARLRWGIVGERLGTADRWGRRTERGSGSEEKERRRQIGPTEQREGEGKRGRAGKID